MDFKFKKIKYRQISTAHGRGLRLDDKPGVYAWFRDFDLRDSSSDKGLFIKKVESFLDVNLSDTFHSKVGLLYDIVLTEKGGNLPRKKMEWLESICEHQIGRQIISDILLIVSDIQSPLYIGKAKNIKSRIAKHINGQSELAERLQNAGINLDDCFIKVIYLDGDEIDEVAELIAENGMGSLTLLIEDLITRLGPAAFVRRPG